MTGAAQLTGRQHAILEGLAAARSRGEVCAELGIRDQTLRFHLSGAYGALGVRGEREAVAAFRAAGMDEERPLAETHPTAAAYLREFEASLRGDREARSRADVLVRQLTAEAGLR